MKLLQTCIPWLVTCKIPVLCMSIDDNTVQMFLAYCNVSTRHFAALSSHHHTSTDIFENMKLSAPLDINIIIVVMTVYNCVGLCSKIDIFTQIMLGGLSVREKMFLAPDTIVFQIIIDRQTISSPTHSNTTSIQSSPSRRQRALRRVSGVLSR